ncbi:MAG: hypothetical protein LRZ88_05660 [Candidatus Cloacimonetes bacterium]|nr:hypothetical protein [Candidatus Cloacimonadota bacterium]
MRALRGTEAGRSKDKAILMAGMNYFQMPLQDQKKLGLSDQRQREQCLLPPFRFWSSFQR